MDQNRPCNRGANQRGGYQQRNINRQAQSCIQMPDSCQTDSTCKMPVGSAYVPSQTFGEIYDTCTGLKEGTIFPELNLVFCGVRGNGK